jgi:hypothetical protein
MRIIGHWRKPSFFFGLSAVGEFVKRYNTQWRLEKMGYQTPVEARNEPSLRQAA